MDNEVPGTTCGISEEFSVRTEELEKIFIIAECLLRNRFDFKRNFEFVMENDPDRPSTQFKLRYLDGYEAFLEKFDKMSDEEIATAEKEESFLDALSDALIYMSRKGNNLKFSNPKTAEKFCDAFNSAQA